MKNKHNAYNTISDIMETIKKKSLYGDCFLWQGKLSKNFYGKIRGIKPKSEVYIHRISWEYHFGAIPDNLKVLHTCDIRNCWNPEHLFLGTQQINMADMLAKGRHYYKKRDECSKGHKYTIDTLYIDTKGRRNCKICRRGFDKARRERNKILKAGKIGE